MTRSAAEIFHEAREMPSAKREGYLVGACGRDLALRARVEALLKADAEAGGFLASPTRGPDADPEVAFAQEEAGAQIDRYKLLERIGEGGMGTIWMAEQREPVKRRVALKIIKLGMDTKQVIARFEAERQALAMMDHPHIAKVLDAGATSTGRPYFVMEYIKGMPILEYCDREKVDTQARLELFTSVCHAIQHAHQKGIIHRDIKPSNVLVTLHDGVPVPKVIDFGIAKATSSELTTRTLFTEHRQMIGTPAYMSPEQAELSGLDIDTRSDIYSLGVLLYELLTGTTPFDVKDLMAQGFAEMMRTIREVEPHKPSTRISSLGETGTRTALQRKVDLKKLGTLLRGDLDWIVMKCLEKDRSRRYDTANGLAADIRRHLADEPVTAGAPSAGYRLRKFVRRNRAGVLAGGSVAALLVLGVIGTTLGMLWANRERDRAGLAKDRATSAAVSEEQARREAQESERIAVAEAERAEVAQQQERRARKRAETISEFVTTALRASDAANAGGDQAMTILQAMDNAIADIESGRFRDDPETEVLLRITIGAVLRNNGRLQLAERLLVRAHEQHLQMHEGDCPHTLVLANDLASVLRDLGRPLEAEPLLVEALETHERSHSSDDMRAAVTMANLATVHEILGRLAQAEVLYLRSLEMVKRLHPGDHMDVARGLDNLGKLRLSMNRPGEGLALLEQALEMRRRLYTGDHPDLAVGLNNLASAHDALGHREQAGAFELEALQMYQRLYKGDHPEVARSLSNLACDRCSARDFDAAELLARQSLEMIQRLFPGDHPQVVLSLHTLGSILQASGRFAECEPIYVAALAMSERVHPPGSRERLVHKASLAKVYWGQRKLDKSLPLFEELARDAEPTLGRQDPETRGIIACMGMNYHAAGRYAEAIPFLEQGLPEVLRDENLRITAQLLLDCYCSIGEAAVTSRAARVAAILPDLLAEARGREEQGSAELSNSLSKCAVLLLWQKDWRGAEPLLVECSRIRGSVLPDDWRTFNTQSQLGGALLGQGRSAEAEPLLLAGYSGMKAREASIPPAGALRIPEALARLVRLYEALGNASEAAAWRVELAAADGGKR